MFLRACVGEDGRLTFAWYWLAILIMTTGTAFLMWLGEQIDEYGIGNGISLLIMAGILARAPGALQSLWRAAAADGGIHLGNQFGPDTLLLLFALFVIVSAVHLYHSWKDDPRRAYTKPALLPTAIKVSILGEPLNSDLNPFL